MLRIISIYFYLFLFISIIISFESCELNNPSNTNINTNTQGLSTQLLLSDMIEVKNLTSVPDTIRMQAIKCVPEEYLQTYCTIRYNKYLKDDKEIYFATYSNKVNSKNEYLLAIEYDPLKNTVAPLTINNNSLYKRGDNFIPQKINNTTNTTMARHIWRAFEHANYQGRVLDCWWDVSSIPGPYDAYIPDFQNVNFNDITSSFMMHCNNQYLDGLGVYLRYDFYNKPIIFGRNAYLIGNKKKWFTSHNIQNFYDYNFDDNNGYPTFDNMNDDISSISVPFITTSN
jgi:hypothetical protein